MVGWIRRQSPVMEVWEDPEVVDDVLWALYHRLDDSVAVASSRMRHRRVLNVAMEYVVRRIILSVNPLPKGLNNLPRVTKQVDPAPLAQRRSGGSPAGVGRASGADGPVLSGVLRDALLRGSASGGGDGLTGGRSGAAVTVLW